jgi:outer membrane protein OmpA-like peptidoglycan-associated protein/tetratricopeptide (TPR) repeat protein
MGQEECGPTSSKKAQKLVDKVYNSPKATPEERLEWMREALDADENCLDCRFILARQQYQLARDRNTSYDSALQNFQKVIDQCPTYHADAFYYAGIISYGNQDYEAAQKAFEGFLAFDSQEGKVSRDYDEKVKDVATVLPEIRFYVEFYKNPVAFNPVKVEGVNTPADEYLPTISPDNELIFFTRKEMVKARGDLYSREVELFMQGKEVETSFNYQNPQALPPPFNVGDNYGGASIALDNREMYITVCQPVNSSYKNCDLFVTRFEKSTSESDNGAYKWTGLENLGPMINTPDGWEAQPTLSADGNTLYFATVRENTLKDSEGNPTIDIYYSVKDKSGKWTLAKPLGEPINTGGNDKSPFLHTDSKTLYFSSNGRLGAGGYDIYFSRQNEDGSWSKPENLGFPINSPNDEHGLVVSTDGSRAFFASSKLSGSKSLDIYSFEVPRKARPQKVLVLKGDVKDEDGKVIDDARIELKYTDSREVEEIDVRDDDGSYAAVVNLYKNEDVVVSVKSDTQQLAFNSRVFTLADTANTVQTISMEVPEVKTGETYRINDIQFALNSSDLSESSKRVLDDFAEYLVENSELIIEIGGHTDDIGDPDKNMVLSTDRAFEVFGYLQEKGVKGNRMTFRGYGQTKPLVPNDTEENRRKNRRTEFKMIRK